MQNKLKRISDSLVAVQRVLGVTLAVACPIFMVIQIFLRVFFKTSIVGYEEILIVMTVWLYMIGGANTSQTRTHIDCGILSLYMKKERTIRFMSLFKSVVCLIISIWASYWGLWFFRYSFSIGKVTARLQIPTFLYESAIFIGIAAMTIYCAIDLIQDIKSFAECLKSADEKGGGNS